MVDGILAQQPQRNSFGGILGNVLAQNPQGVLNNPQGEGGKLVNQITSQIDPLTAVLSASASGNLSQGLLAGRQARLQQAQDSANAAAGLRKEGRDERTLQVKEQGASKPIEITSGVEGDPTMRTTQLISPQGEQIFESAPFQQGKGVTVNTGNASFPFKVPVNHIMVDRKTQQPITPDQFAQSGASLNDIEAVPLPGGPAERRSPGDAAKEQLVQGALTNLDEYESLLFDPEGGVNRGALFNSNVPMGGTPFTEGRTMNSLFKDAMEGKIRIESGAAVPDSEVARGEERFRPSTFDSDETIRMKLGMLRRFSEGTLAKARPEDYKFVDGQRTITSKFMDRVWKQFDKENAVAVKQLQQSVSSDEAQAKISEMSDADLLKLVNQ